MDRRQLLAAIAGVLARPLGARAQPAGKMYRVGTLGNIPLSDTEGARVWGALIQGLRELGYVEGQNLVVEHRSSEGRFERLPALAAELALLKPDVIVAARASTRGALAARNAARTTPIVVPTLSDPLGDGLIASFARPGGNVTGLSMAAPEMAGKQLELLKEIVPRVSRIAILSNPSNRSAMVFTDQAKSAARVLGIQLQLVQARRPEEIDGAFAAMRRERAGALLLLSDAMSVLERTRIADLAAKDRLPAMYTLREHLEAGGLAFYGPAMIDNFRRAAAYVDKILKGTKPAELPVEQPTKFELVINIKTARVLGLSIPPAVLARADQLIQ